MADKVKENMFHEHLNFQFIKNIIVGVLYPLIQL